MEKILPDAKKYLKVTFNPKGKANREIVNILDIESSIKKLLRWSIEQQLSFQIGLQVFKTSW